MILVIALTVVVMIVVGSLVGRVISGTHAADDGARKDSAPGASDRARGGGPKHTHEVDGADSGRRER